MCGIAGGLQPDGRAASPDLLLAMAGELRHRGPDGVGLYLDDAFGMAASRLAVIDVEGGDQPIGNETGRYWVVQNGEIYNHPELARELASLGHRFATRCDTEVLVHAYEQWGADCLKRLNGAFAFAVWDRQARELFLARDRFGIRPLFLAEYDGGLWFASEAKALLRHPSAERALDPAALVETFTLWSVLPDRSAFVGIRELPAGHWLRIAEGRPAEQARWWDLPFAPANERPGERRAPGRSANGSADPRSGRDRRTPSRGAGGAGGGDAGGARSPKAGALAEELRDLLDDATRIRLRSDVPVGVYVSGGLDSSAIAAYARRHAPGTLRGFGVGFADARFDESRFQDRIAASLGVDLERVRVDDRDIAAALPRVVELAEKPLLRTAPAPLLSLSAAARRAGFRVVLTGEGADEVFAGYNIFREAMVRRFWARRPDSTLRPKLLERLYPYVAGRRSGGAGRAGDGSTRSTDAADERHERRARALLAQFFGVGLTDVDDPLYSHRIRFRNTARCLRFLSEGALEEAGGPGRPEERLMARLPEHFARLGPLSRAQYLEMHTFMEGYLLHAQGDRMLMGNSVEGRFPFLDHRLVEFAARVPERLRLRGLDEKYILRKAVEGLLSDEVADREKRPYRAPIAGAFAGAEAPEYARELLSREAIASVGLFRPDAVAKLAARASRAPAMGETDEMALVGVLTTMLLHERMVARPSLAAPAVPGRVVVGDREVASGVADRATAGSERRGRAMAGGA